eukprot:PLAT12900.2.p1 GENE.PLAT12900.2~~PLAT12900.2.p1  ORF type:complete len:126 (-),score=20.84 PLAT12900.2:213-539(-)
MSGADESTALRWAKEDEQLDEAMADLKSLLEQAAEGAEAAEDVDELRRELDAARAALAAAGSAAAGEATAEHEAAAGVDIDALLRRIAELEARLAALERLDDDEAFLI